MPHTPEQREKAGLCGAKRKHGLPPCRAFAGQGTDHPGVGRCKWHLGRSENHGKQAIKQEVKKQMVTLGEPDRDVTAVGALLSELYASTGHVAFLRQEIADMDPDELGTPAGQVITSIYDKERHLKIQVAKLCHDAGVDEAQIRIAEVQVTMLGQALKVVCDRIGMPTTMQRQLGAGLRQELSTVSVEAS